MSHIYMYTIYMSHICHIYVIYIYIICIYVLYRFWNQTPEILSTWVLWGKGQDGAFGSGVWGRERRVGTSYENPAEANARRELQSVLWTAGLYIYRYINICVYTYIYTYLLVSKYVDTDM